MRKEAIKRVLIGILMLALVAIVGRFGIRAYVSLRQDRLMSRARMYLAKSDIKSAMLCIQRVLRSDPKNADACRLMADMLELGRSSQAALLWRSRVVEINPGSAEDRLSLARLALTMRDYMTATSTLEGVPAAGKNTLAFQNLAGTIAAATGRLDDAQRYYLDAARLEPQNPVPVVNIAVLGLQSTNDQTLARARTSLQAVTLNPTNGFLRCKAIRELVLDAVRHKEPDRALVLSKRLVEDTNSSFSDRILRMEVLAATTNSEFNATMEAYQRDAATSPVTVYEVASWQLSNLGPTRALSWLKTLPMSIQTNQPVALLEAECYDMRTDADGLLMWLQKQNWSELEFLRHAFLSRALRKQKLSDSSKAEWQQALKAANNQKASLALLLKLAAQWGMGSEGEDILWVFVNRFPTERWAFETLGKTLYLSGRTRDIMTLCNLQAKKSPADLPNKNNLAATALLLNAKDVKPHDLAREVYEKSPTNPTFASTYAFSLYLQKKNTEALQIIEKLDPKSLQAPSIAGYYGLILQAAGSQEKAKTYFEYAFKSSLLPEERELFEKAISGA